jgi:hypothetical protein
LLKVRMIYAKCRTPSCREQPTRLQSNG